MAAPLPGHTFFVDPIRSFSFRIKRVAHTDSRLPWEDILSWREEMHVTGGTYRVVGNPFVGSPNNQSESIATRPAATSACIAAPVTYVVIDASPSR